ncbi:MULTISPECIES: helix-turn-helix domain-containing protein [Serratia]|uniref:Transcriptional regulator n=1 Tax=Serratia proteamaculans TaxID=28151 RepID=A0A5Q2VET0_SERPR|nr:helix-turn-helix transcriptional regulator [Serratia proteamaculans]QGH62620.1 transcriptional regulator [Serratia proteamaculans]
MQIHEKMKAMRMAEGLSQSKFSEMLDISISTVKKYDGGFAEPGSAVLMKILQHPRFIKYTLWMMTGQIAPESGQIAPALAHSGQESAESSQSEKKIG